MAEETPISEARIKELQAEGYSVSARDDHGTYAWANSAGATWRDTKQPPRLKAAQAWYDCDQYAMGNGGAPAREDWGRP